MKNFFLATASVMAAILCCLPATAAPQWRNFTDPDRIFSFDAPAAVQRVAFNGNSPTGAALATFTYAYGDPNVVKDTCQITISAYDGGRPLMGGETPEGFAAQIRSAFGVSGTRPATDTAIVLNGRKGWQLNQPMPTGDIFSFRWFDVNDRLFQFGCMTSWSATPAIKADIQRMEKSLRLLK